VTRWEIHTLNGVDDRCLQQLRKLDDVLEAMVSPPPSNYRRRPRKVVDEVEFVSTD